MEECVATPLSLAVGTVLACAVGWALQAVAPMFFLAAAVCLVGWAPAAGRVDSVYTNRTSFGPVRIAIMETGEAAWKPAGPGVPLRTKTTIVLMSFSPNRTKTLIKLVAHYAGMPLLVHRVILIWNNQEHAFPIEALSYALTKTARGKPRSASASILLLRTKTNSIVNRMTFSPRWIKTASVLILDDDVSVSGRLISGLLHRWNVYPRGMVGLQVSFLPTTLFV